MARATFSPFHGEKAFFLLAPGFGRMRAQQFAALIDAAKSDRAETLRLTTSRQIAIVGHPHSAQEALTQNAKSLGFLTDPADPRLRIVACAGKPACASAARDVQADALALADILPRGGPVALHVSGCAKGCARGAATPITLIAREDGYDVVFDGRADAMPATHVAHLAGARALIASRLAAP